MINCPSDSVFAWNGDNTSSCMQRHYQSISFPSHLFWLKLFITFFQWAEENINEFERGYVHLYFGCWLHWYLFDLFWDKHFWYCIDDFHTLNCFLLFPTSLKKGQDNFQVKRGNLAHIEANIKVHACSNIFIGKIDKKRKSTYMEHGACSHPKLFARNTINLSSVLEVTLYKSYWYLS